MVKLVALTIPVLLFIFGQPVFGVISLIIPLFVFLVSWIIKSNKQQPGESDEDYAKRMENLKEIKNEQHVRDYDLLYKNTIGNVFYRNR